MQDFNTVISALKTQLSADNDAGYFTPKLKDIEEWTHRDKITGYPSVRIMVNRIDYDPVRPENATAELELWVYVTNIDSRYAQQQAVQLATAIAKRVDDTGGGSSALFNRRRTEFTGRFEGDGKKPIVKASLRFEVKFKESIR